MTFRPLLLLCGALAVPTAFAFDPDRYLGHLILGETTVVATEEVGGLEVPWEVAAGPDGWIWFTQHAGTIHRLDPETGEIREVARIAEAYHKKSLGLLGMALHPDFNDKPYVFIHYTYRELDADLHEIIKSRLVRYRFENGGLAAPEVLLDPIPGKSYHNGSRIVVTSDDRVYLTTGDAGDPDSAQDPRQLSGKILRLALDGSVPADNPFPGSLVWSLGHRNAQGLALGADGRLYASEHGPNNDDEVNLIEPGRNYGWPVVEGFADLPREKEASEGLELADPLKAWTPTIAAAGLDYYGSDAIPEWRGRLLLVSLKGRALRALALDASGRAIVGESLYFQKRFGRIRDLCVTPSGDVYLATSNLDWHPRYQPWMYDTLPEGADRIIRLRAASDEDLRQIAALAQPVEIREDPEPIALQAEDWSFPAGEGELALGERLYAIHCAACHLPNGAGVPGLFPPLVDTDWVSGDKTRLIQIVLQGMSEPIVVNGVRYEQEMPGFATRSDEEIAAILTFIRSRFGGGANAVIPGEVHEERKASR